MPETGDPEEYAEAVAHALFDADTLTALAEMTHPPFILLERTIPDSRRGLAQ